jgi:hypothetical protein
MSRRAPARAGFLSPRDYTRVPVPRQMDGCPTLGVLSITAARAVSSAGEHSLHTRGVTGSIPVPPTITIALYDGLSTHLRRSQKK